MRNVKLSKLWDSLRSSYWFLPGLMAVAGMALAFGMLALDQAEAIKTGELSWIYTGGPEGARGLLSAVASSMVTVAATAFSITIVALQLAASNFGPRLLRNFMQDTGNQIVLGTFIATFLYCLLVLRTIHGEDYNLFVPQLSVTVGIGLAIASIGVLIYFIHHASTIIQASHVIAGVADELDDAIDRLFPEEIGQAESEKHPAIATIPEDFDVQACFIRSTHTGYLQAIDNQLLLKLACKYNLLLRLTTKPGDFIAKGNCLVLAYPEKQVTPKTIKEINQAFLLGKERTEQQDIEFPINQLVEIALRALSPGINDPFTAIRCIDRLSAGLSHLAERQFPSAYRYDDNHKLRVIAEPIAFEQLVDTAFNQTRHYGKSDVAVTLRLLKAIAQIASHTHRPRHRLALEQQAEMILQGSREGLPQQRDQQMVEDSYRQVAATWRT
ncbi:DUF2254 domain-containing protein [Oscillatoria sp. FACHB-1407]|uniref:DUF2254 domain-containing protein n=1 Tax=Oscillatoria sp. FACHB-1407 TaxID=2692847 RepID=UPI00168A3C5E|nr:DUF2254 domain-containing protein [Oscillatoria sp. FACHB-1407]MBD2465499.1 DUF2254 domain-containing protein [Oscillatoria sp. FACHB-1407]